jgi:hypothetical protein
VGVVFTTAGVVVVVLAVEGELTVDGEMSAGLSPHEAEINPDSSTAVKTRERRLSIEGVGRRTVQVMDHLESYFSSLFLSVSGN